MSENDDRQLFREVMNSVQPLSKKKRSKKHTGTHSKPTADIPPSTLAARRKAAEEDKPAAGAALSEAWVEPIEPEQTIQFSRPGIQNTRLRQLRQGMLPVQLQLDLHGYRIDEAREIINEFIQESRHRGYSCVCIVHGKSHRNKKRQSTLKSHTNHWLRQIPEVLAFCSAPASEGGTGSVLILLKKARK